MAFASSGQCASAPASLAAQTGEMSAPEDLLPHLPLHEAVKPPKGASWAEWNGVERFRGMYECRRASEMSRGDGTSTESGSTLHAATARFEIERRASHFEVVNVRASGSLHESSASDRSDYHGRSGKDGAFEGGADLRFDMHPDEGTWTFEATGTFAMAKPYTVKTFLKAHSYTGGKWVDDVRANAYESRDFPHSSIKGVLPAGKPSPFAGTWSYVHGTLKENRTDDQSRVFIVPEYKDVELVVELEGTMPGTGTVRYDQWIPRGTLTGAAGSRMKIKANLQSTDGGPVKLKVGMFVFKLSEVSREPGVCMNFPRVASAGGTRFAPDLKFAPTGGCDAERQQLELPATLEDPGFPRAEARVDCFDYGAWGNLTVTAELEDGRVITGHLKNDNSMIVMPLPKHAAGSHIADAWRARQKITAGDEDDAEELPRKGEAPGDGFTLYEEYRGFAENNHHIEGDPVKIDFFVRNYIGADAAAGINLFEVLTGAAVHYRLNDKEFDREKRVLNLNHAQGSHGVDQHGVYLTTLASFDGARTVFSKAGVRGRPGIVMRIEVQPRWAATPTLTNENAKVSDAVFAYDRAITHELVHAVGGEHHGSGDMHHGFSFAFSDDPRNKTGKPQFWLSGTERAVEITDEKSGRPLAEVWEPDLMLEREKSREYFMPGIKTMVSKALAQRAGIKLELSQDEIEQALLNDHSGHHFWYLGAEQGQCSGDENCVMRYSFAQLYEKKGKSLAWYYVTDKHTERLGMGLCTAALGTGINEPGRKPQPRYGNAAPGWGPCADRIIFNDALPLVKAP
jgi:hypothetical protein